MTPIILQHPLPPSILTDRNIRRNHERRAVLSEPSLNRLRSWDQATCFKTQNQHNNSINWNINLDLGFSEIKDKTTEPIDQNLLLKAKSMNQPASNWNWNIQSPLARSKLLTNWSNNYLNNTIQLLDFLENQITREDRITVARVKPFFWPKTAIPIKSNSHVLHCSPRRRQPCSLLQTMCRALQRPSSLCPDLAQTPLFAQTPSFFVHTPSIFAQTPLHFSPESPLTFDCCSLLHKDFDEIAANQKRGRGRGRRRASWSGRKG